MSEIINSKDMLKKVVDYKIIAENKWDVSEKEVEEIISCFIPKENDIKVDMSKLDYRIFTADYYRQKYPHFPEEVLECLAECSQTKIGVIKEEKAPTITKKDEETIITFD